MKKFLLLVSCFVVLLILSKVSFSQEAATEPLAPCPCVHCGGVQAAMPFAYPPYPAPRTFGSRLAGLAAKRAMPFGQPPVAFEGLPSQYQYSVMDLKPRAVRRIARMTPQPQPYPVPVMVPGPPVGPVQPVAVTDATSYSHGPVTQTGQRNTLLQRSGGGGISPVINFLSIVRAPREPYAGYYPPYPTPAQHYPPPVSPPPQH